MITEKNINKMNELLSQEEFAQKILEAGSYENAYKLFAENGVDASYDEFMAYIDSCRGKMVSDGLISEDGEMGIELLDMVSGGRWYHSLGCFALAGAAFYVGAPEAGVLMVVAGIAVWKKK